MVEKDDFKRIFWEQQVHIDKCIMHITDFLVKLQLTKVKRMGSDGTLCSFDGV